MNDETSAGGSSPGAALVAAPNRAVGLLRPIAPVREVIQQQEEVREYIAAALQPGRDYGVIPGTDRADEDGKRKGKNNLLKPGAERVCAGYGVRPEFSILEQEVQHDREVPWQKRKKKWKDRKFVGWEEESGVSFGLYRYVIRCELVHVQTGTTVGSGVGSCSTMESKYVDRPRDSENTVLKMAKKRAYVDATLTTFGLSDAFTQDMEDVAANARAEAMDAEGGEAVETVPAVVLASADELDALREHGMRVKAGDRWFAWLADAKAKGVPRDKLADLHADLDARAAKRAAKAAAPAGAAPAEGEKTAIGPDDMWQRREQAKAQGAEVAIDGEEAPEEDDGLDLPF
jgi:hypothetical protein